MLRSRMLTPGFKLFFGLSLFLLVGALILGISTQLQLADESVSVSDAMQKVGVIELITGPITVGWKGAVGNHLGYAILLGSAVLAGFLAFVLIAFRDADPEALAELVHTDSVPLTRAPAGANYAPITTAFALGLMAIGLVNNKVFLYAGLGLLVITIATWTVRAWADRATGDDEVNREIYHRIIDPLRVPVLAALVIAFVVIALSRLILAAPNKAVSSAIFGGAAVLFFAGVLVVAFLPKLPKAAITALLAVGALLVLAGGVYGIVQGERPVEHESGGHSESGSTTEGGAPAVTVAPPAQSTGVGG